MIGTICKKVAISEIMKWPYDKSVQLLNLKENPKSINLLVRKNILIRQ